MSGKASASCRTPRWLRHVAARRRRQPLQGKPKSPRAKPARGAPGRPEGSATTKAKSGEDAGMKASAVAAESGRPRKAVPTKSRKAVLGRWAVGEGESAGWTLALRRGEVGRRWIEEHRLKRMLQKALARSRRYNGMSGPPQKAAPTKPRGRRRRDGEEAECDGCAINHAAL